MTDLLREAWFPYVFALAIAIAFLVQLRSLIHQVAALHSTKSAGSHTDISGQRLNAYERLTVFLERNRPENIVRNFSPDLTPIEFVFLAAKSIDQEWEFNAAQQLYISKNSWEKVAAAKNLILKTLHDVLQHQSETTLEQFKFEFLKQMAARAEEGDAALLALKKDILM